jgi:DNA-binding transcriptional LysR family regulator
MLAIANETLSGPAAFDPAASRRIFRIAAPDHETALFAPALMRAAADGGIGYSFRAKMRDAALQGLAAGELDLAMGYFWRAPDGVERQALYDETYAVVMRADHPARARPLTPKAYAALDHVLVSPGGDLRGVVDERLAKLGLSRRVVAATPYFFAAFAAVAESEAVATLPRRLAERYATRFGLVACPPPIEVRTFPIHLAWSVRDRADPGLIWLRERFVEAAAQTAPL